MPTDQQLKVNFNDFDQMRACYENYLHSQNFSHGSIEYLLSDFDIARWEEDYDWIHKCMRDIGVILVEA